MTSQESGQFVQLSGMPSPSLTEGGSSITFSNLTYEVKNKHGTKRLVDNVSVTVKQGQVSNPLSLGRTPS